MLRSVLVRLICLIWLALPAQAQPNIVLILADDFSMNLMPKPRDGISLNMPNLARMMAAGMVFDNYFVTNSLCCPSRASIFTGMLPHNSGVLTNKEPDGGYFAWMEHGNDAKSFALALQGLTYRTALMGKYLNEYRAARDPIPPGWNNWATASTAYEGYGYLFSHNGVTSRPSAHMTDQISQVGRNWIRKLPTPFFLELSTFAPHAPYTPPLRYAEAFADIKMPKTPAFGARPDAAAPQWLQDIPALRPNGLLEIEQIYRKRVQAAKGIDDMIGDVRGLISRLGLSGNTYVIFTSDNGYHMGEYSLRIGKTTPFDVDINVPFVIVGPGIAAGSRSDAIVSNIDLHPTFVELAGGAPSSAVDGRSMVPLFFGGTTTRTMAVVEHKQKPVDPTDPDAAGPNAGDPPSYIALRMKSSLYVEYETGEISYYDMTTDPYQLHNVVDQLTPLRRTQLRAAAEANRTCAGANACGRAQDRH